jgi:DNA primase
MSIKAKEAARADSVTSFYERDYYDWIQRNVHAMREGRVHEVDWANVAEELEDMGKSEKRALRSQLARLIAHLLKWAYQPKRRSTSQNSWRAAIKHARQSINETLGESPSLRPQLPQMVPDGYGDARAQVLGETGLPEQTFPAACPWSLEQIMAEDFRPDR